MGSAEHERQCRWLRVQHEIATSKRIGPFVEMLQFFVAKVMWMAEPRTVFIEKFSLKITRTDIDMLIWTSDTWLNDNIINFYMELINQRNQTGPSPKGIFAFNSFFANSLDVLLMNENRLQRWMNRLRVNIFQLDKILIPANIGNHWTLLIIHMNEKVIENYDSLGRRNRELLEQTRKLIASEHERLIGIPFDQGEWRYRMSDIPIQENGYDCGIFVCQKAESVSSRQQTTFRQKTIPILRQKMLIEIGRGELFNNED